MEVRRLNTALNKLHEVLRHWNMRVLSGKHLGTVECFKDNIVL